MFFEVECVGEIVVGVEGGEVVECIFGEVEDFVYFVGGVVVVVGDDVGDYGGVVWGVVFVDFLDDFFVLVVVGEVEIDVGLGGFFVGVEVVFVEEMFEEEFMFEWVYGGDVEYVVDGVVGGVVVVLDECVMFFVGLFIDVLDD